MNSSAPYKINWLNLEQVGYFESIGIGGLAGCKHRFIQRNLEEDLRVLKVNNIRHLLLLCDTVELDRFGLSISCFYEFELHHYPCEYGLFPSIEVMMDLIRKIFQIIEAGEKCLIMSRDGLGRSCVVGAVLVLHTNESSSYNEVYSLMKRSVDPRAIQTVKQYNFLVDFRQLRDEYTAICATQDIYDRHISR